MKSGYIGTFFISILGTFLVGFLLLGSFIFPADTKGIVSPKSEIVDPFDKVQPKLEKKENDIKLSRDSSLIQEVQAAGPFNDLSAYIVVDCSNGEVITEKDAVDILPIASITKIMTAVVAADLAGMDESFTVSETAPKVVPTNMGLIPGQSWTLEELLHGLLLTSSNDTAEAIKEGIDGKYGTGTFIRSMNAKAHFLGLSNTSFDNPQGYDGPENYSTTEDLAVLSLYLYKNYPDLAEIVTKAYQFYPASDTHKKADLINWNGLLGVYPGIYGLKIGNTEKAGKTTIVASEREGEKVLVVLLGAPGVLERDLWASQLLDLGFFKKFGMEPVNVTEEQLKEKYASWREISERRDID